MEKAIILDESLNKEINIEKYDFIYIGSEFCFKKIPSSDTIKKINHKNIVLMTPILTDNYLKIIKKILDTVKISEIIINDLGLLEYLIKKHPEIKINIGRVLATSLSYSLNFGKVKEIITKHINAIEIDNLLEKNIDLRNKKFHFHYPFSYLTHSLICHFKINNKCNCFTSYTKLDSDEFSNIYAKQNAYFLYKKNISPNPLIKRVVYQCIKN
jgi:hypothetical protein